MVVITIDCPDSVSSVCYLIRGTAGSYLIDTGIGSKDSTDYIRRVVSDNLGDSLLSGIILTHCHIDHVGGASVLSAFFGCPIYIGALDAEYISSPDYSVTAVNMFLKYGMDFRFQPIECTSVEEGHVFDLGDYRLRVISTPGHSPGSICLYDESSGWLFSGDTVFAYGVGRTDLPGGSIDELRSSILKLRNLNISNLSPGHGASSDDGARSLIIAMRMVNLNENLQM